MVEKIFYFVARALKNMRQSPFLATATVLTIAVALTIVTVFGVVLFNLQRLSGYWSQEVQVVAFLDQPPTARVLKKWTASLEKQPEVEGVNFVSQKEAFARFEKRLGEDADLLKGITPEVLPASLEIILRPKYRQAQGVNRIVGYLQENLGLKDLHYGREWLERFESFLMLLRALATLVGGFLLFAALFIVSNTIRLTMYARREELEIMTLVGGTPLFVKTPFLLEGALQGVLGGGAALGIVYLLFQVVLKEGLKALLLTSGDFGILFLPWTYQAGLLGGGVFLGLFGSTAALRKFIRI